MEEIVVYTCITGDYDVLLPPVSRCGSARYICFTDNLNTEAKGWEVCGLPEISGLNGRTALNRYCKLFPWEILPPHRWSIYIDANIRLIKIPKRIIDEMINAGVELAIPIHPNRSCIWQEALACQLLKKISHTDLLQLNRQLERYQAEGFPPHYGLTENNIIFRSGESTRLLPVMEQWWFEFQNGIQRDQLSLPYVLWSTGFPIYRIPFSARQVNPYFRIVPHNDSPGLDNYLHVRRYHGIGWSFGFKMIRLVFIMKHFIIVSLFKRNT